jgi:hypothetical protein
MGETGPERTLERLAAENRALRSRVSRLSASYLDLENRMRQVERSVVFRFLRWLGAKLSSLGVPVAGTPEALRRNERDGTVDDPAYAAWVQETASLAADSADQATVAGGAEPGGVVTVLLFAPQNDPASKDRAMASLQTQRCQPWELVVWTTDALEECRGEFVLLMSSAVALEPYALRRLREACGPDTVAVYSDWDHVDRAGRRHSPRFTPECSPELLSDFPYWGPCFLARTATLRALNWPEMTGLTLAHWIAQRLAADHPDSIARVPRMLWHLQSEEPAQVRGSSPPVPARPELSGSIVVCSRTPGRLRKCLQSLKPGLDSRHEVIVVAHQAGDGPALDRIAQEFGARPVRYEGAFHFGIMNARGVQEARGDAICLLNDDVTPITPDWLERMLAQCSRPGVGIAGALLLYPDGSVQHAGLAVGGLYRPAHLGRFQRETPYWPWLRMTREVTAVTGACMAMRRAVWDELGGFDRRFPVNYNDIDLCLRAGERGYRILLEARALLTHEECATRIPVVLPQEAELFYDRWEHIVRAPDRYFNPQLSADEEAIRLPRPWTELR